MKTKWCFLEMEKKIIKLSGKYWRRKYLNFLQFLHEMILTNVSLPYFFLLNLFFFRGEEFAVVVKLLKVLNEDSTARPSLHTACPSASL